MGRGRCSQVLAWLFGAALLAGCGESKGDDDDDGNPSHGTPVQETAFGKNFASAMCRGIGPCCAREGYAYTEATCLQTAQAYIDALVAAQTSHAGVAFNESAAGGCVELYREATQACTDRSILRRADNPCSKIFQGTVPEGGHCGEDTECADVYGDDYPTCEAGVCTRAVDTFTASEVHAKLGEPCGLSCYVDEYGSGCSSSLANLPTHDACWREDGLVCNDNGVCEAIPAVGAPCPDYVCNVGAYCNQTTRVCTVSLPTGPCLNYDDCASTSYCDTTVGMCIALKANGVTCNTDRECQSGQCEGDVCHEWTIATPSLCAGLLDD